MNAAHESGPFPFARPFSWSLLKLELLEKYADALAKVMGSQRPVALVDLMAGEGYYDSGDAGSSGRLARIAADSVSSGRDVRVIAVEENAASFTKLEANTSHVRSLIDVRHAPWQAAIDDILEETAGRFVLFFVDPMGIREIRNWSAVSKVVSREHTELLVNFNSSIAARVTGHILNGGRPGFTHLMNDVMDGADWLDGAIAARAGHRLPEYLAAEYAKVLARRGKYSVAWSPIARDGDRGPHKYHVMFASRHDLAFRIMNDIFRIQQETLRRERVLATPSPLLPRTIEDYEEERELTVLSELATSLADDASLRGWSGTIDELRNRAFLTRFGDFMFKDYAGAVTLLLGGGQVVVDGVPSWRSGKLQLKTAVRFPS
ncbi:MAG: three-Cys-motif partner protein TcmP [Dehalococcoidia bacterium]